VLKIFFKDNKTQVVHEKHEEPLYAGPGPVGWAVWHTPSRPSGQDSRTSRHKTGCCSGTCRLCTASFPDRPPTAGKTKCGQKLASRPPQVFRASHLSRVKWKYGQKLATRPPQVFQVGHLPRAKRSLVKDLPLDLRKFSG
jgi:hypothetical protein